MLEKILNFSGEWLTNTMLCVVSLIPMLLLISSINWAINAIFPIQINVIGHTWLLALFIVMPTLWALIYAFFITLVSIYLKRFAIYELYYGQNILILLYAVVFLIVGNIYCSVNLCYI